MGQQRGEVEDMLPFPIVRHSFPESGPYDHVQGVECDLCAEEKPTAPFDPAPWITAAFFVSVGMVAGLLIGSYR